MTSLLSARKRAEEFAAAVDGGADESTLRPELAELVGVVGTLQRQAQDDAGAAPRPEFTATLRERLMAEAASSLASDTILTLPVRKKGSRERRMALVASSLVLVGGTAGMAAAAQNALPGEALYPIKRGLEKAQTGLATSRADKGEDLLAQADNRLVEVRGLFDGSGNLSQVPGTIDEFTKQALEASDVLIEEFETSRDATLIEELRTFAADNLDELRELSKSAAPEHQDELAVAAEALMQIDSRARAVCPSCADELRSLEMPRLFLTANEAREAMDAVVRVRIDNSHPVMTGEVTTKPAGKDKGTGTGTGTGTAPAGDGDTGTGTVEEPTGGTGSDAGSDLPDAPGDLGTSTPDGGTKTGSEIVDEVVEGVTESVTGGDKGTKTDKGGTSGGGTVEDTLPEILDDVADTLAP